MKSEKYSRCGWAIGLTWKSISDSVFQKYNADDDDDNILDYTYMCRYVRATDTVLKFIFCSNKSLAEIFNLLQNKTTN
jgi:hypothetical protein